MEPQVLNTFLQLHTSMDLLAKRFKVASGWFNAHYAAGFAKVFKNEAMELWELCCDIKEYILLNNGKIEQAPPRPAIAMNWQTVDQVIASFQNEQKNISDQLKAGVNNLMQNGKSTEAIFLSGIFHKHLKELREINEMKDHLGTDPKLVSANERYFEKYSDG